MDDPHDFRETLTLIRDARAGDAEALSNLFARYQDRLLARVRGLIGHEARAFAQSTDILQDLFVELIRDFDRFELRDDDAFLKWAVQVARNNVRDLARRCRLRRAEKLATSIVEGAGRDRDKGDTPADRAIAAERIRRLEAALAELPEDYRTVVELRNLERLSYREIAERLDRPTEGAVQMLHARAMARLGRLMDA